MILQGYRVSDNSELRYRVNCAGPNLSRYHVRSICRVLQRGYGCSVLTCFIYLVPLGTSGRLVVRGRFSYEVSRAMGLVTYVIGLLRYLLYFFCTGRIGHVSVLTNRRELLHVLVLRVHHSDLWCSSYNYCARLFG